MRREPERTEIYLPKCLNLKVIFPISYFNKFKNLYKYLKEFLHMQLFLSLIIKAYVKCVPNKSRLGLIS